jgi:hypothetical protein
MFKPILAKYSFGVITLISVAFFICGVSVFASSQTQLSQTISAGTLGVDIVDAGGNSVTSPSVSFSSANFSFDTQQTTGTLGVAGQKIRVSNGTNTATWSLTIAATSGNTATWSDGSHTMDFNDTAANGRLTVNASGGTITPTNSYTTTGLSKGSSTAFNQGVTDSVTLLSAASNADKPGRWDFTGVSLTQDVPAGQSAGSYALNLTLTAS